MHLVFSQSFHKKYVIQNTDMGNVLIAFGYHIYCIPEFQLDIYIAGPMIK